MGTGVEEKRREGPETSISLRNEGLYIDVNPGDENLNGPSTRMNLTLRVKKCQDDSGTN